MASIDLLYDGIECKDGVLKFALTEVRGDWKFQKVLRLGVCNV